MRKGIRCVQCFHSFIGSFTKSSNKYLLSIYYESGGTVCNPGDTSVNKTDEVPALIELTF